ncbi:hypothetical protein H0E87_001436 [Populus deltoides]|uniref:Uncharacterized protein n=1 Tax=Populus deltoides TaxID=3696 RepID=A0A8T2ZRJ0_POPDE|nr:hypothetical protein H0E87_001436 [Populus deltoides]
MGDEWFGVYAFCSLILLAFGQTLGHVCMLRVVILWSGYCQGLSSIGCWDELRAGYGADGVGACVVAFTVPVAGAYSENLPVIGLLDFVL